MFEKETARQNFNQKLNNKKKREENDKSKSSYFIEKRNRYHAINTEDSRKKLRILNKKTNQK